MLYWLVRFATQEGADAITVPFTNQIVVATGEGDTMRCKTIALPGLHDLDIAPILPIVDSGPFGRLRDKKQLGISYLIFPSANHTRFEHSLGVYSITCERALRWRQEGSITEEEARHVCLYALCHDLGHGAYSHDLESLCATNHNSYGLAVLRQLRSEIEACGGDLASIESLYTRVNPLACGVSHRQLGTDKIDYLLRDARHTNEAIQLRVGDLLNHVHYLGGRLVADLEIMAEVELALSAFVHMYDRVYLRKPCLIARRFLQKIVAREMACGDLLEDHIWQLTDEEINACLIRSQLESVRKMFVRLKRRRWPKEGVVITAEEGNGYDRLAGKPIAHFRVPLARLQSLDRFRRPQNASVMEKELATLINVPEEALLVLPVTTPDRFVPEDIDISEGDNIIGTLKSMRPGLYQHFRELWLGCAAVRVCVYDEYRERLAEPKMAQKVCDYLFNCSL